MNTWNTTNEDCRKMQPLLSDLIDNALSARQVWDVEKHLAGCHDCTRLLQEIQQTVQVLQTTEQFDTGDDFMARLHARLDTLDPASAPSRPLLETLRDGWAGMVAILHQRSMPVLGLSMALTALAALLYVGTPGTIPESAPHPPAVIPMAAVLPIAQEPLQQHVALSATNPLDDPAAANLEAQSANAEGNPATEGEAGAN